MGVGFLVLLAVHLLLHWNWIVCVGRDCIKSRKLLILAGIAVLLAAAVFAAALFFAPLEQSGEGGRGYRGGMGPRGAAPSVIENGEAGSASPTDNKEQRRGQGYRGGRGPRTDVPQ
jgi:hypothetical protein